MYMAIAQKMLAQQQLTTIQGCSHSECSRSRVRGRPDDLGHLALALALVLGLGQAPQVLAQPQVQPQVQRLCLEQLCHREEREQQAARQQLWQPQPVLQLDAAWH